MGILIKGMDEIPEDGAVLVVKHDNGKAYIKHACTYGYSMELVKLSAVQPDHTADIGKKVSISCGQENDLISRQAALKELAAYIHLIDKTMGKGLLTDDDCMEAAKSVLGEDELSAIQPATSCSEIPNGSDGTISRQAAIDALDIAIERYDEMAEEYRKKADIERNDYMDMRDNAYEAQQLAQWLNELKYLREKIEQITIMPEPRWTPCSGKLPSETVIATVETKSFKHRYVCEAVWIPRWTWKASFDEWEDCSEYNEDDDEYYVLEGWYERIHNWDEYAYVAIDDNVIAWMPLPEPYRGGEKE